MSTPRLTPAQLAVLRLAAAGRVHRPEGGLRDGEWFTADANGRRDRAVTAIMNRLFALDLVAVGERDWGKTPAVVTPAGRAIIDAAKEATT